MRRAEIAETAEATRPNQTSIEKALALLGAFDGPYLGRGLTELVRDLGIPRPTLHRILKQLADGGFIRRLPSKRYQIGLAAPIRDRRNEIVAAICLAGRNRSLLKRRDDVIETANAIGHDLSTRAAVARASGTSS